MFFTFQYAGRAQAIGALDPNARPPRGEVSFSGGPLALFSGRFGTALGLFSARAGGPLTEYVGLEVGFGGILLPRPMAGLLQGNVLVNLVPDQGAKGQFIPFLTGGTGIIAPAEPVAWVVNYGGGFKYYFTDRLGFRVDVRDHILPHATGFRFHGLEVGVGLTIRF